MKDRTYTIQEVEERTQVPAATLRQWERRYGFPQPERSDNGYRTYSSLDVKQIMSMRDYIDDGMPSSKAAELVQHLVQGPTSVSSASLEQFAEALTSAFVSLNETKANQILSEAYALHRGADVFIHVIQQAMFRLGERWHAGELDIATEHFASNYVQARLRSLLNSQPEHANSKTVVVGCGPLEQHELGALMVAVLLRQAGYHLVYLGANNPIKDVWVMAERLKPTAVLLSVTTEAALRALLMDSGVLKKLAPVVAIGGSAVSEHEFKVSNGVTVLPGDVEQAVEQIGRLLQSVSKG